MVKIEAINKGYESHGVPVSLHIAVGQESCHCREVHVDHHLCAMKRNFASVPIVRINLWLVVDPVVRLGVFLTGYRLCALSASLAQLTYQAVELA